MGVSGVVRGTVGYKEDLGKNHPVMLLYFKKYFYFLP
jgi:hypothetical protein